tara:strand:- start:218 stop:469 length:252 start_codon:yes stop_codon:yes gene_type:complete
MKVNSTLKDIIGLPMDIITHPEYVVRGIILIPVAVTGVGALIATTLANRVLYFPAKYFIKGTRDHHPIPKSDLKGNYKTPFSN